MIQKRVYTFHFDRLSKESSDPVKVTELVQKMDRARKERAVVCSTPEAVKSVMLKYVASGVSPCIAPPGAPLHVVIVCGA